MKNFTQKFIGLFTLVMTMSSSLNAQDGITQMQLLYDNLMNDYQNLLSMLHACEENCNAQGWELAGQIDELNATISSLESMNSTLQSERNNLLQNQFVSINIPLELNQGWNMFGFTCNDSINAIEAFYEISESIEIVKDEWGLSYLPSWDFNAIGSLKFPLTKMLQVD